MIGSHVEQRCPFPHIHTIPRQAAIKACSSPRPQAEKESTAAGDVVVIGAGIVGLSISRQLLRESGGSCSVHLIDSCTPGHATGAGQGYVWMSHRQVGTSAWELANWSCQLWKDSLTTALRSAIEWQDMGSLLLASNALESQRLKERAALLQEAGLSPILLDSAQLKEEEPSLRVTDSMTGLLLSSDAQINGRLAAAALSSDCSAFGDSFVKHSPAQVTDILINKSGVAVAVQLSDGTRVKARKAVVLSAGVWSASLLAEALGDERWLNILRPRKGHLLEIPPTEGGTWNIQNGLMEIDYAKHHEVSKEPRPVTKPASSPEADMGITFTATQSASGSLLLGSSREFCGFSSERLQAVELAILAKARKYLPALESIQPADSATRVGLRPFSECGPIIGPAESCSNLLIATGHEGSGLTLAPATASLVASMLLEGRHPEIAQSLSPKQVLAGWTTG